MSDAAAQASDEEHVEVARAIIAIGNQVLLAQGVGESFYHLPGGHVEAGEDPAACCVRELREELGREISDLRPVATFENVYDKRGVTVYETNHVFVATLYPALQEEPPRSAESHLRFTWHALSDLDPRSVMPPAMLPLIHRFGGA